MYPKYLTPLQNIKWVGTACEEALCESRGSICGGFVLKYMQWVQMDGCVVTLMKQYLSNLHLPCHDLTPIATEIVNHWLPVTSMGLSTHCLF